LFGSGKGTYQLDSPQSLPSPTVLDQEPPLRLLLPLVYGQSSFKSTLPIDRPLRDDLYELPLPVVGERISQSTSGLSLPWIELERSLEASGGSDIVWRRDMIGIVDPERGIRGSEFRVSSKGGEEEVVGFLSVLI
jgi:hypothetical protein